MNTRTVNVKLSFPGEPETLCQAEVRDWSAMERARRAVFGLAFFWVLAGIFLPIPPIHWVLVPTFLLAGPVFAVLRLSEKMRLQGIKGSCPRCKVERTFPLSTRYARKGSFSCDQWPGNLISLEEA